MKMFNDSHLEVKKFFKGTFFTHPYEAGWAMRLYSLLWLRKSKEIPYSKVVYNYRKTVYIGLTTVVSL